MTDADRIAAEERYPALQPDADELTYPRAALREFQRGAFVAGVDYAREQIAQELHDWAALHAGPDGAFFADLWERRIARGES